MYESWFGLGDRPFAAAPAARRYFPAAAIENARQTLARCIDRAEGAALAIGPAGSGKSILCQVLAEQFRGRFHVALLTGGRLDTRRALLQAILFELGLPYRGMDEGELRLSLVDHITAQETTNGGLVLLIDEAHGLTLRLLAEIHQFTNLVRHGQPRVRVVLTGSPILEEHLGSAKLESFNQCIAARCYLQSFKREETLGYVHYAISQVGGNPDQLFAADALDAIHRATDGVPRLVNQLCDHALLLACAAGIKRLTAAAIEEAWADLQQLPTPWNAAPGVDDRTADIIEFGSLDEPPVAARLNAEIEPPRLRTVAEDEERLFSGEPIQRIERIKDQLGTIDETFQPAGTIGPEVDLVFPNSEPNPFEESFEQEELIVDRFSATRTDPLAGAPVVRSTEGAELSSLLAPHARVKTQSGKSSGSAAKQDPLESTTGLQNPPGVGPASQSEKTTSPPINGAPSAATLPPLVAPIDHSFAGHSIDAGPSEGAVTPTIVEPLDQPTRADAPSKDLPGATLPITRGWLHPSEDPVMPEEPGLDDRMPHEAEVQPTIRMPRIPSAPRSTPKPADPSLNPVPARPNVVEAATANEAKFAGAEKNSADQVGVDPDDSDIIVVEDDPVPPPSQITPSAVRRQEYRQLFARLRRG
jgi:type II secretory pathway predicted ATPase ExeA